MNEGRHPSPTSTPCLVVGIGAAAGGQEPLEQIFTSMPTDCGLAFVVVMDLPPEAPCFLAEMLSRYTTMEVVTAQEGMPLEGNRVHVVPAGMTLTLSGSRLHLEEVVATRGSVHHVDRMLRSLAEEWGKRAVAVVLSGSGSDGALGARLVHEAGGIVMAQEPDTAMYPEMPRGAIAAAPSTLVLSAEEIPERIAELSRGACALPSNACHITSHDEDLATIFGILHAATGHHFGSYKPATVLRRIERRMAVNDVAGIGKYIALLRDSKLEAQALCQDILIGVTRFFRDPEAFAVVRDKVLPRLLDGRPPDAPLRIWHAGCASGEEVYSMAILVREYLEERNLETRVLIFASDIDEVAIAQARSGLYGDEIEEHVGPERLQKFFAKKDGWWQVAKPLREMVVFAHHSLVKDPPFSHLDLLVCRNFLIYLNRDMQKRLIAMFHQVINPGGILFLGSSETTGHHADLFATVDKKWKIFETRDGARRPEALLPFAASIPKRPVTERTAKPSATGEADVGRIAEKLLVQSYAPPSVVVNERYEVLHVSTRMTRFLEVPAGGATRDILRMAREELRPVLRAAIYKVCNEQQRVDFKGVKFSDDGREVTVNVVVEPVDVPRASGRYAMVVFQEAAVSTALCAPACTPEGAAGNGPCSDVLVRQLEEQLRITHEQLQATTEQLETSHEGFLSANEELMSINEEFQSANEELQSTNEELETSKEELQALNEELSTVNTELHCKLEELNIANSDMHNLLSSSGTAALFLDRNLRIKGFTPAVAAILNLIRTDIGRPFEHIAGKIDWHCFVQDAELVLAGEPFAERVVNTLEAGRCFLKRLFPYVTCEGDIDGVVVVFIDITERKAMEDVLQESEQRVRLKLESILSPEGDVSDLELADIIDANSLQSLVEDFYRLTRLPMGLIDLKGKVLAGVGWQEICTGFHRVHPETSRNCVESDTFLSAGVARGEYKVYRCKNNMWDVATPVMIGDKLFGNLFMGQFFFEDEPLDLELYRQQAKKYGFDEKEYLAALQAVPRLDRETLHQSMSFFMKLADSLSKLSYSNLKLARSLAERDALLGELKRSQAELHVAKEAAEAATLTKSQFLANMSHELRTPMTGVLGMLDLALTGNLEEEQREFINAAHTSARSLVRILNDILDLTKMEMGKFSVEEKPFSLRHGVEQMFSLFYPAAKGKELDLCFSIADDVPEVVVGDQTRLHQVLTNLVSNAVKFTEKGKVEMGVSAGNACRSGRMEVTFAVSDTGIGIPDDKKHLLFGVFSQIDESHSRSYGGTGLGLVISKEIVERMGGRISFASEEGKGSTFSVTVPLRTGQPAGEGAVPQPGTAPLDAVQAEERRPRILVGEDDGVIRQVLGTMLKRAKFEVDLAETGQKVVQMWEGGGYDLILMDIQMPGMNGFEATCAIREKEETLGGRIPIVAMTAHAFKEHESKCLSAGMDTYISKPIDFKDTLRVIMDALGKDKGEG